MVRILEIGKEFEYMGGSLLVKAPAKINLSLLVAGKRPDGYHDIETIMAKIDWCDELLFENTDKKGIELFCTGPQGVPGGSENLVYRACEIFYRHVGAEPRIKVTLNKNVHSGAGLGGGSSDAAAAIKGLNRLVGVNLPQEKLSEMAGLLGSDIPFFLGGPLAFCTGRGEKIKQINKIFDFSALLVLPNVSVSTKKVYESYRHEKELFNRLSSQINGYVAKNRIDLAAKLCANMLAKSCFSLNANLGELKGRIESLTGFSVCLSGSGSSMYILFFGPKRDDALKYQSMLKEKIGCDSVIVSNNRW